MKDLKVVALNGGLLFLKSLECLTNLQMLRLQYCTIKDNTNSLGKLKSLEVLRISNSDIKELPIEVGELSKLRVMDFSWCSKLKRIPPDVIRRLSLLEELYFCGKSFRGWEIERRSSERSNASLSELNSLPNLKVLYGEFHISSLPQDFSFGNLDRYDISLRGSDIFPEHLIIASATRYPPLCRRLSIHDTNASSVVNTAFNKLYENVEFLELYLFNNAQEQVSVPTTASSSLMDMIQTETTNLRALQKLKSLSVSFCNNMGCILPEKLLRRLQDLEAMEVDQCYGVQEIFGLEGSTDHGIEGDQEMLLSNLTSLSLAVLPQLSFIWKGPTQKVSLRCLVRVNVFDCHGLAYLFPRSLALNLVNLRELGIISCKGLKQIISMRAEEDGEAATHHQPHPLHFPTLTTLTIQNCPNLEYIFPISTAAGGLPQLETLVIADATKLKHVFGHGRVFVGDPNDISLPKLNKLVLGHLLSLTNFCQANFHCKWPSLPHVVVNRCPMLTSLPYVEVEKCPTSQLLGIQKTTQLVKEEMAEGPSTSQTSVATSDPTSVI
ncbi:hypothetical protein CFOL_v3_12153 [Cephalotus follicularis]|uniref:Disease resistance protein At4g27190-like leucine-rich repeats domain-containing protein n=1 Tax=Cephalotus follicularis TaxID=3775 RepID=A0A1Q3BKV1_CEPFO|nr:hypothetical protein CFOL_v3_12153 [Cephalotus follicularis]